MDPNGLPFEEFELPILSSSQIRIGYVIPTPLLLGIVDLTPLR